MVRTRSGLSLRDTGSTPVAGTKKIINIFFRIKGVRAGKTPQSVYALQ